MKNKIYGLKRATTRISNNAAKRLIPLGMYGFRGLELSNSGARVPRRCAVVRTAHQCGRVGPERRIRCQHSKVAMPVRAWRWHQSGDAVDQLQWREVQSAAPARRRRAGWPAPGPRQPRRLHWPGGSHAGWCGWKVAIGIGHACHLLKHPIDHADMEMHVFVQARCPGPCRRRRQSSRIRSRHNGHGQSHARRCRTPSICYLC